MNNWFVGYTGLERRDLCMKPLNKVLIYISTLENHRKAGVGKSPNQSFLFI